MLLTKNTKPHSAHRSNAAPYGVAPLDDRSSAGFYPPPMAHAVSPRRSSSPPSGMPVMAVLPILILGGALFYFSVDRDYLLGKIAAVMITPLALHGLWRGGFRKTFMLTTFVGLGLCAGGLRELVDQAFAAFQVNSQAMSTLAVLGLGALAVIAAHFFSRSVRRRFIMRRRRVMQLDQLGGVVIGLAEGALVLLTMCWMSTALAPFGRTLAESGKADGAAMRQAMGETILRLANETKAGPFADFVERTNPVRGTPALAALVDEMNRTGRLDLDNLDPKAAEQLQDFLKTLPSMGMGDLDKTIKSYEKSSAARAEQYKALQNKRK